LKEKASEIPQELAKRLSESKIEIDDLILLKESLDSIISFLSK
jgi:hypothetical protein